jgi:ribosome recycling factor
VRGERVGTLVHPDRHVSLTRGSPPCPVCKKARQRMDKAIEALRREFAERAHRQGLPALLDTVRVEAYGSHVPLNQVATVSAPEPRMLIVQPWDRAMIGPIEKGIQTSDLGLNPSNDGKVIRVPIPALTEERRKEYVKLLHKMAEEGASRSARRARRRTTRSSTAEGRRALGGRGAARAGRGAEAHEPARGEGRRAAEAQGSRGHGGVGHARCRYVARLSVSPTPP